MDPKNIITIIVSYVYFFFELFMNLRQRKLGKSSQLGDKGSLVWLYALITLGYALSFSLGMTKFGRVAPWNTFFMIGIGLIVTGFEIRITSILTLRKYFSYSVSKLEDQQLIEQGIYRYIRHPGYLGQLLLFLGIATSLSNWASILAMTIPVSVGFLNRIKVEERFMVEQFGEKYMGYMKKSKRIIPLVF
jgi:protein-S-isoprenylcysteine O-methyltransferase Ste14